MKPTITLGMPTIGTMRHQAVTSLAQAVASGHINALNIVPRLPVHQARQKIVETTKTTHLLFVDDDMVYTPADISALVRHAGEHQIVAGLCYKRSHSELQPVVFELHADGKFGLVSEAPTEAGLVDAATLAFTLVDMDVFKAVGSDFSFDNGNGEDMNFFIRLARAGIRTLLEPAARIGHLTDHIIGYEAGEQW